MTFPDKELVKRFLTTIPPLGHNTKRLFALGFVGLNGSGKSTVAWTLAEEFNLYVASNDAIRRFLNDQGFPGDSPRQELLQEIAEESSRYLYNQGISHVIDADLVKFHGTARENAKKHGAELFLVLISCPENVMLSRLRSREAGPGAEDQSRVGVEEYRKRKRLHQELGTPDGIFFEIHTDRDLSPQIEELGQKLKQTGAI